MVTELERKDNEGTVVHAYRNYAVASETAVWGSSAEMLGSSCYDIESDVSEGDTSDCSEEEEWLSVVLDLELDLWLDHLVNLGQSVR